MNKKTPTSLESFKKSFVSFFNIGFGVGKQLLFISLITIILLGVTFAGVGLGYFASIISNTTIPSYETMQLNLGNLSQTSSIHFNSGEMISEVQTDLQRETISTVQISHFIKQGVIATEDSYFYEHQGFVPKAVLRATLQELVGSANQTGGSTLTQQLVKQQLLSNEFTFTRKAKELVLAMRVEKFFSKDDILTAYLNVSPFGRNSNGQNIAGIETAAQGIFGVSAKDVSLPQAAFLAGLPQSPYYYTPYTNTGTLKEDHSLGISRMHIVLNAMRRENFITQEQFDNAIAYDITQDFVAGTSTQVQSQSYLYQTVVREATLVLMEQMVKEDHRTMEQVGENVELYNDYYFRALDNLSLGGYRVYSTIDKNIYNAMQSTINTNRAILGQTYTTNYTNPQTGQVQTVSEPPQTGAIAIENQTGKVLGFIGGTDFSTTQTNHAFVTRRSPGSTIKPLLVYAPAIENNVIAPATMLADTTIRRLQGDGTYWQPTNASGTVSERFVTARHALTMSLNNPTIHLYSDLLNRQIDTGSYMQKMGIDGIAKSEYLNEAASVGGFSSGPTVAEQTSAFTTFANNGIHKDYYVIERIEDREGNIVYQHESNETQVFSQETAYLMRSMLADSVNNGTTQYFKRFLNFDFPTAYGKTGTSDNYEDMWTIISTPQITIGQWAGWDNSYGVKHLFELENSHGNVSVRTQQVWANVANAIHSANPSLFNTAMQFTSQPDGITTQSVLQSTGTLPGEVTTPNGQVIHIDGAMHSDLFKSSYPAQPATYNFSPGASSSDLERFFASLRR